jgi:integrase/recombinase XerD
MTDSTFLGPWIRRFLLEYLVQDRNLSGNTLRSYRDCLTLLLPFLASKVGQTVERLTIEHLSADHVRFFLHHVEEQRHCAITTRNQRLAAIHSFAHFIGLHCPEHVAWSAEIHEVPFKKSTQPAMCYLEKDEMDALLAAPDRSTAQGRRDHRLLLFLYNSGARADEAAQLVIANLNLLPPASVTIVGKGARTRHCPLWVTTADLVQAAVDGRRPEERVFLNRCNRPITRFGIHTMVERYVSKVTAQLSWFEAALFVNWLNTSTGNSPAYNFDANGDFQLWQPGDAGYKSANAFRNSQSRYVLPSVDEWYKAAFYDPVTDQFFDFPNGSNIAPIPVASGTDPNTAVWNQSTGPVDIMLTGGPSPFGTIAQAGNVLEWEETELDLINNDSQGVRGIRGSDWGLTITDLDISSSFRNKALPTNAISDVGFRIASIPEPSTCTLALAVLCLAMSRRRILAR